MLPAVASQLQPAFPLGCNCPLLHPDTQEPDSIAHKSKIPASESLTALLMPKCVSKKIQAKALLAL